MKLIAVRRAVQVLVVAVLCALPWLNAAGWRGMAGSFFALDFLGLPFADPVGAAQVAAMGFLPAGRLLGGAMLSLAAALLLGRVFCSWVCPYGLLSELLYALRWRRAGASGSGSRGSSTPRHSPSTAKSVRSARSTSTCAPSASTRS